MSKIIGIDLGTTNSVVAVMEAGDPVVATASGVALVGVPHDQHGEEVKAYVALREGESLTLHGGTGEVIAGVLPTILPELGGAFAELMKWTDRFRKLKVRTNADTPQDAEVARHPGLGQASLQRADGSLARGRNAAR